MLVERIDARWRRKLNSVVTQAMVHDIPGFGPPKIVLTEHPKSGGTWVCRMIAEYLDIPFPRNRLPPRCRCILHGHYLHVAANDTIVMWRDGRIWLCPTTTTTCFTGARRCRDGRRATGTARNQGRSRHTTLPAEIYRLLLYGRAAPEYDLDEFHRNVEEPDRICGYQL